MYTKPLSKLLMTPHTHAIFPSLMSDSIYILVSVYLLVFFLFSCKHHLCLLNAEFGCLLQTAGASDIFRIRVLIRYLTGCIQAKDGSW